MKQSIIVIFALCLTIILEAQEFNATVIVNTPQLQTADPKIFNTLKTSIRDMFNNTKWTEDEFEQEERIEVTLTLNITEEISATAFKANLAINASRPVFNSNYETVFFNYQDQDIQFTYEEYQPVEFSKNVFQDNYKMASHPIQI